LKPSPAALAEPKVEPDYVCSTLTEAIDFIARNTESSSREETLPPSPLAGEGGGEGENATTPIDTVSPDAASPEIKKAPGKVTPSDSTRSTPHPNPLPQGERGPEQEQAPTASLAKLESLAAEILREIRRRHEQPHADFSVSKLLAGVVQVIVLAVLF